MRLSTDSVFDHLSALLAYPQKGYHQQVEVARAALAKECPAASVHVTEFAAAVRSLTLEELEELFTRTFDMNPVCILEVGWQLYGDEYKRGEFLVKMRQSLDRHNLTSSTELPDHLTQILPLLDRLPPDEARTLAREYVAPAVRKMLAGIEGKRNPFGNVIQAVREAMEVQAASGPQEVSRD